MAGQTGFCSKCGGCFLVHKMRRVQQDHYCMHCDKPEPVLIPLEPKVVPFANTFKPEGKGRKR